MENYNQPLTEAEETFLHTLSKDPDPCARLKSNYYQLRTREAFANYTADLAAEPYADYKERQSLQEALMVRLEEIRREYDADVDNAIRIHLVMLNVVNWRPAA